MAREALTGFVEKLVLDIRYGRIRGATEVVENIARAIERIAGWPGEDSRTRLRAVLFLLEKSVEARPTSILLANAARRILSSIVSAGDAGRAVESAAEAAGRVVEEYSRARDRAAKIAASRIKTGDTLMTFSYSTSVARAFEYAVSDGKEFRVYVPESRPRGEGLYTASLLDRLGVEAVVIVDSAMNYYMREVDRVVIGAEAIAANGAVINKIGTGLLLLSAKTHRVPVYVVAGTYKFSVETVFGELIELPKIPPEELLEDKKLLELGVKAEAPLMEATSPKYIDAIITEKGLVAPAAVPLLLADIYGSWPPRAEPLEKLFEKASKLLA